MHDRHAARVRRRQHPLFNRDRFGFRVPVGDDVGVGTECCREI
jgi:hypothetical protein